MGHEAVGEVIEVGAGVGRLRRGDKVEISGAVGCGDCAPCLRGQVELCRKGMMGCYGLSPRLQGCQAEAVRVPMADFNAARIPEAISETKALLHPERFVSHTLPLSDGVHAYDIVDRRADGALKMVLAP